MWTENRSIQCHRPEWLVWEERPRTCEDLACQAEGQESASGSHGGGLSLGVAVPTEVGVLTGGQVHPVPSRAHTLCSVLR